MRKSLVSRIADKLVEGGQCAESPTRLPSALSPSRSRAQFEDTIPGIAFESGHTVSVVLMFSYRVNSHGQCLSDWPGAEVHQSCANHASYPDVAAKSMIT